MPIKVNTAKPFVDSPTKGTPGVGSNPLQDPTKPGGYRQPRKKATKNGMKVFDSMRQGVNSKLEGVRGWTASVIPTMSLDTVTYGQPSGFIDDRVFEDRGKVTPEMVLNSADKYGKEYIKIFLSADTEVPRTMDGVIEPLPIRENTIFGSIETPVQSRGVFASLQGGNENFLRWTDQIVDYKETQPRSYITPYLDSQEIFPDPAPYPTAGWHALPGIIMDEISAILPFDDSLRERSRVKLGPNTMMSGHSISGDDIRSALNNMSPIDFGQLGDRKKFTPKGFDFQSPSEGVSSGTDSIAFGGLKR